MPPSKHSPTQMRIHVGPDGDVEFSVSLTGAGDASVVATMVAAVRAGMLSPRRPTHTYPNSPPLPHPVSPTLRHRPTSPAPEPTSDPDAESRPDRAPSPLVSAPPRKLSVRQIAAQLDASSTEPIIDPSPRRASLAQQHRYSEATAPDPSEYDAVREFSSSPALWLTARTGAYLDPIEGAATRSCLRSRNAASSQKLSTKMMRSTSRDDQHSTSSRSSRPPVRRGLHPVSGDAPMGKHIAPDRVPPQAPSPRRRPTPAVVAAFAARPIRMLSLPAGANYDDVNDMYFGENGASAGSAPRLAVPEMDPNPAATAAMFDVKERRASTGEPRVSNADGETPVTQPMGTFRPVPNNTQPATSHADTPADRVRTRRDRALKVAEQNAAERAERASSSGSVVKRSQSELDDGMFQELDLELDPEVAQDRPTVPSSPYVQQSEAEEDEEEDAWENVEYVLTESYRQDPKTSEPRGGIGQSSSRPYARSAAWRLLSSIGNSLSKRRVDVEEDVHQSTLAHGSSLHKTEKTIPGVPGKGSLRRNRGYNVFGRGAAKAGGLWLEFSSPLGVERMLTEVGKVAKSFGYQVWRRPGENKLRCIRRLSHRLEMHMVIFIGSIRIPEGPITVVRLKRARSDRNRTEAWRYSHFYRELIDRLQRSGIEITSDV